MENEANYIWGYNGTGKVDKQAKKRYFTVPHKCKKLLNFAPDLGIGQVLISELHKVSALNTGHLSSCSNTDCQENTETETDPKHICQHEDRTFLIRKDGSCCVIHQRNDGLAQEHSIVKKDFGTEDVKLKFLASGDMHTVGISDESVGGCITKHSTEYIFRPFVPSITCKQMCCGKEHVLLLSNAGKVYSYGLGSRGQLGHGLTDKQTQPKLVEAIESVSMATISAGGWHSAAISDIQDLYIWGWNESGQLGFKMKPLKRSKVKDHSSTLEDKINSKASKPHASALSDAGRSTREDSYSQRTDVSRVVNLESSEDEYVLFHLEPQILDLLGGHNVSKVSCGSRHSAAVTDAGLLYTWGWGEYGQLGHGDRHTRDTPSLVQFLPENNLVVTDVLCQEWNTAVLTKLKYHDTTR